MLAPFVPTHPGYVLSHGKTCLLPCLFTTSEIMHPPRLQSKWFKFGFLFENLSQLAVILFSNGIFFNNDQK